ncbi:glycoside hydrolase family 3 N-terminal domain-containing protein [Litorimonas sp. WD9-15]|uniref:glycoside hydrolase family 3 N-terminal domain-containing protein n=1 Tax=Litorimonas sp. WD9-15 TaxID=3418716 RepID=UPI003D07A2AC
MKKLTLCVSALALLTASACQPAAQLTSDNSAPVSTADSFKRQTFSPRVEDMIAEMTLDEKLAQISCVWLKKGDFLDDQGNFQPEEMEKIHPHGIGCFARPQDTQGMEREIERKGVNDATVVRSMTGRNPAGTVALVNDIQKWHIENTRLGIPTLFHEEGLHGYQAFEATSFPQSIALAATFDDELAERIYSITAREIRARGVHHVLSPVVDVALDPRWGRIEETFGEDPYLVSRMGVAAVKGFQGLGEGDDFPIADDKVLTTLKHMTGHGQPEAGMNVGPANVSDRTLYEVFFPPFEAAVQEAKAASVMASYNEIDGVPSHANSWLLNDVLRDEWGFDGAVVADYFAINELQGRHGIVDNIGDAGALSLRSGVDMELPDGVAFYELKERIEADDYSVDYVDQAVGRVLTMKERGRVFETPYADADYATEITGNAEARAVALEAAQKAPVLLKNDGILPLDRSKYKRIAVIGPNAAITVLGGYSDEPKQTISILDGIEAEVGDEIDVVNAQGVTLTDNRSWWDDEVNLIDPEQNMRDIGIAVSVARGADLVILAIGGDESTSREAWSETHPGDRNEITLIGQQKDLVDAIGTLDIPTVGVVISGRPLALSNVEDNLDAILYGWILGQETGTAVADILFGKVNPSGKMPVSVPRTVGQIPAFYYHKPTARRGYAFGDASPLYAFGHGLSYTSFEMSEPTLSNATIGTDGTTTVSIDVTNSGDVAGDEIVQMYIRDKISSVTRPVKELKGFERVSLEAGETKTVSFDIGPKALRFYDINMNRVVEPGAFDVMVGNSSQNLQTVTLEVK